MNEADSQFDPNRDLLPLVYSSGFLETFSVGLLLRDESGTVVDSNRAIQDLLNVSAPNLIGQRPFDSRWNPVREDGSSFPVEEQPAITTLHSGNPSTDVIVGIDVSSRARRWLSINTFPILLDGAIKGELDSITDVTLRRQEQHVIRLITEMNKLVMQAVDEDQFLAAVSNLLVNVGGYALVAFVLGA